MMQFWMCHTQTPPPLGGWGGGGSEGGTATTYHKFLILQFKDVDQLLYKTVTQQGVHCVIDGVGIN